MKIFVVLQCLLEIIQLSSKELIQYHKFDQTPFIIYVNLETL